MSTHSSPHDDRGATVVTIITLAFLGAAFASLVYLALTVTGWAA